MVLWHLLATASNCRWLNRSVKLGMTAHGMLQVSWHLVKLGKLGASCGTPEVWGSWIAYPVGNPLCVVFKIYQNSTDSAKKKYVTMSLEVTCDKTKNKKKKLVSSCWADILLIYLFIFKQLCFFVGQMSLCFHGSNWKCPASSWSV